MSALMQRLHQDHIHITRLINILEDQVSLFHRGKNPDYGLMLDIMHYMMNYPDIAHHAVEEMVFKKLILVRPQLKDQAQEITQQHHDLADQARKFARDLQHIIDGHSILARDQIEQKARCYIKLLREHLRQEETDLLPAVTADLRERDFIEVENNMPNLTDPLGNLNLLKKYETLYHYITNDM